MEPVRIACVRYLNTLPLIHGLDKLAAIDLKLEVPSRIAALVRCDGADVGLVSLIDAVRPSTGCDEPLAILPVGMIGCDGPTLTVRLFSSVPLDRVTMLHADSESHTSVALCRIVLDKLYGVRPEVVAFDARAHDAAAGGWPATVLLIGDKVVADPPPADRFPHQLDLGQAWKELTGWPFVYAAWMCRAGRADSASIRTAAAVLDRQRRRNRLRLDGIAERSASEHGWPTAMARRYLGSLLRYEIGPREREAAERFVAMAAEAGIVPAAELAWSDAAAIA
ncbi:MAG: menaquinone biosynthetic enzyme MqnA/MqnD family protein [Phycisphaerales bacterium]